MGLVLHLRRRRGGSFRISYADSPVEVDEGDAVAMSPTESNPPGATTYEFLDGVFDLHGLSIDANSGEITGTAEDI